MPTRESDAHYHLRVAYIQAAEPGQLSRHLRRVRWSSPTDCLSQSATKTALQKSSVWEPVRLRVVSLKKVQQLYCNWKPRVLGLLSCSYSWFLFSYYLTFSSFLHFALFLFFWSVPGFLGGVPGFLGGVPGFLWAFRVFLRMLLVSSGCSGFFGWCSWFFGCSVMFRDVPVFRVPVFLEVLHALAFCIKF